MHPLIPALGLAAALTFPLAPASLAQSTFSCSEVFGRIECYDTRTRRTVTIEPPRAPTYFENHANSATRDAINRMYERERAREDRIYAPPSPSPSPYRDMFQNGPLSGN